ncbi:MAG: PH domain-containing protein [Thermomicrobiales bacterium]|nr:PH domain-containing protein [Thermomicrobiales bacterium]
MNPLRRLARAEPPLIDPHAPPAEPIVDRPLHWFSLYTFWKTLPITIGLVTLVSLLPGVIALLIIIAFGLFYEFGEELPFFLKETVLQDVIDYELQGFGPIYDQLRANRYHLELMIVIGLIAASWIVVRTLQWKRTTYGIDREHIWIKGGLYWKWERRLPMARVQTLELRANWLDRLLDLRSVEFVSGTPDRSVATIRLAAVPTREAVQIQRIMLDATTGLLGEDYSVFLQHRESVQLAEISTRQLFAAGITSFEIRLSFVGAIAAFHLFSKSVLKEWRNDLIHWFVNTIEQRHAFADLVDFTLLLALMFWLLSVLTFVATFSRFQLQRAGHLALIEHGLVTRRWRAVLLPRVQAITFVETPVQEYQHAGSIRMELSGSHQKSLERKMLLPSLPREEALATLERLFGGAFFDNISRQLDQFHRVPASGRRMYSMFWVYRVLGLTTLLIVADWLSPEIRFEHLGIAAFASLAIPGYFYGRRQFTDAGWLLNDDRELIVRERQINRRTIICPADRVQWRGVTQLTLPFKKPGPATVVAYVAASGKVDGVGKGFVQTGWPVADGRLRIRGLPRTEADSLLDQIGPQESQPLFRPHVV